MTLPISPETWSRLVAENQRAHEAGWAQLGVFAAGIGPDYHPGSDGSLLYVGKSAGPLGSMVGSGVDQLLSARSSSEWMISRRNKSAFWQMAEGIDPTRHRVAWTNLCKMDRIGGRIPPKPYEWSQIREVCLKALAEEISSLCPKVVLFATSDYLRQDTVTILSALGFVEKKHNFNDGRTSLLVARTGQQAVLTKHPQGWLATERDKIVSYVLSVLS